MPWSYVSNHSSFMYCGVQTTIYLMDQLGHPVINKGRDTSQYLRFFILMTYLWSGQFCDVPTLSQWKKCQLPLFASLSIQHTQNCALVSHVRWFRCTMFDQWPLQHESQVYDIRGHQQYFGNNFWLGKVSGFQLSALRLYRWDELCLCNVT